MLPSSTAFALSVIEGGDANDDPLAGFVNETSGGGLPLEPREVRLPEEHRFCPCLIGRANAFLGIEMVGERVPRQNEREHESNGDTHVPHSTDAYGSYARFCRSHRSASVTSIPFRLA